MVCATLTVAYVEPLTDLMMLASLMQQIKACCHPDSLRRSGRIAVWRIPPRSPDQNATEPVVARVKIEMARRERATLAIRDRCQTGKTQRSVRRSAQSAHAR
jgi:hypothetical protein